MKRVFIIFAIVLGFFIAMPIAASPPGIASSNEIVINTPSLAGVIVAAPIVAAPALVFQNVIGEFVTPIIFAIIVVVMLAGLMSGTKFPSNHVNAANYFNPRARLQALARDQCSETT